MNIITTEQALRHLRLDDQTDSEIIADVEDKLLFVSASIIDYLDLKSDTFESWTDSSGNLLNAPQVVKLACMIWLGIVYKNRDGESDEKLELGEIPRTVSSLLWRHKRFGV